MRTTVATTVAVALLLAGCAVPATGGETKSVAGGAQAGDGGPAAQAAPPLAAADVKLAVKIIKKECFGSAGCNLQYEIKASTATAKIRQGESYDVTYVVKGLTDDQIGTLVLKDDGTYDQDSHQSGETKTSAAKLTAIVTDVERNL